jgi:predicted aspartyl protease
MKTSKRYELNNFYSLKPCGFNLFKIKAYLQGNTSKDDGILVDLLLDTGASYTIIQPKIINALGYDCNKPIKTTKMIGLGGKEVIAPTIPIISFNCIGQKINNFEVQVYDPNLPKNLQLDGILGMNFMKATGVIISVFDSIIASHLRK